MRAFLFTTMIATASIACGGSVSQAAATPAESSDAGVADGGSSADATLGATGTLHVDAGISACGELAVSDALAELARARAIGLFEVVAAADECTDLGGAHVVFRPVKACAFAAERRVVEWGGHGCRSAKKWQAGDLAVLGVDGSLSSRPDDACLASLPAADGVVRAIQPVSSTTEGEALLAKYACSP